MKTISDIIDFEPRVNDLLDMCNNCAERFDSEHTKQAIWYYILKPYFLKLVGFSSDNQHLQNSEDYDTIYNLIINTLNI